MTIEESIERLWKMLRAKNEEGRAGALCWLPLHSIDVEQCLSPDDRKWLDERMMYSKFVEAVAEFVQEMVAQDIGETIRTACSETLDAFKRNAEDNQSEKDLQLLIDFFEGKCDDER